MDAVVVGAGPAGVACAVQLSRHGRVVVVLERGEPGGLVRNANLVENYPGFPGGIRGAELASLLAEQLRLSGASLVMDDATWLGRSGAGWLVETRRKRQYNAKAVVLATGSRPKSPGWLDRSLVGQKFFFGVAEMPQRLGRKRVAVVGAGDVAFDYALTVAERGASASILARGEPSCVRALAERAAKEPAIEIVRFGGVKAVERVGNKKLALVSEGGERLAGFDCVLVAIGREPEDGLHRAALEEGKGARGLYLVGDAAHIGVRHVACAAGDGIRAAVEIEEMLGGEER